MSREDDIARLKKQLEAQLDDYAQGVNEYAAFMEDWRSRHAPEGKRVARFRKAAQVAAE